MQRLLRYFYWHCECVYVYMMVGVIEEISCENFTFHFAFIVVVVFIVVAIELGMNKKIFFLFTNFASSSFYCIKILLKLFYILYWLNLFKYEKFPQLNIIHLNRYCIHCIL